MQMQIKAMEKRYFKPLANWLFIIKVQNWKEIEEKKVTMVVSAFLKMCRVKHMIPNLLNIESLDELMCKRILTPMTNEENEYMVVKKRLLSIYAED